MDDLALLPPLRDGFTDDGSFISVMATMPVIMTCWLLAEMTMGGSIGSGCLGTARETHNSPSL